MIALKINDIKKMMHTLLFSQSFDSFSLQEVSVIKDVSLFLEGRLNHDYISSETTGSHEHGTPGEFALWGQYREMLSSFFSKDEMPLSFKFVLQAPAAYTQKLLAAPSFTADPSLVKSLILTFRYENSTLTCLTGTAFYTFVPDKSLDPLWDGSIRKALANMEIDFTQL